LSTGYLDDNCGVIKAIDTPADSVGMCVAGLNDVHKTPVSILSLAITYSTITMARMYASAMTLSGLGT